MNEVWEELWMLLEKADNTFNDFINEGSESKLTKFINSWNRVKKKALEVDKYMQPALPLEVNLPFETPEFCEIWNRYKEYISEQHGQMMRTRSEKSALEILHEMTEGSDEKACFILRHAMASRAKTFYNVTKSTGNQPEKEIETDDRF